MARIITIALGTETSVPHRLCLKRDDVCGSGSALGAPGGYSAAGTERVPVRALGTWRVGLVLMGVMLEGKEGRMTPKFNPMFWVHLTFLCFQGHPALPSPAHFLLVKFQARTASRAGSGQRLGPGSGVCAAGPPLWGNPPPFC